MTPTTSSLIRTAASTMIAVALLVLPATSNATEPILCWPAAGVPDYDQDGDGFADFYAHKNDRVELQPGIDFDDDEAMTCPAGYVMARGDTDDSNPAVHPRRKEIGFNRVDDNCDGRIDEPTFYYQPSAYSNTTSRFSMKVRIHDADAVWYHNSPYWDLMASVEYQRLYDTSVTYTTGLLPVTSFVEYSSFARGYVRISNLEPGTVYRARVQLWFRYTSNHAYAFPFGEQSTWYYTMTDSTNTKVKVRKRIVLRALYEAYLSEIGYTGYLGAVADGTRYGGDMGEWWCSEFYSWVTDHELVGMGHRSNTGSLKEYFSDHHGYAPIPHAQSYLIGFASAGDYLAIGTDPHDLYHSAMFLEYEPARDMVWSVEGNVSGLSDIGGGYASRRGGNEARVVERGSDTVGGWGMITIGMLP
jgi:hypothetical protein